MKIEKMDDFFTKRIDDYENRMLNHVEGCREGYEKRKNLYLQKPRGFEKKKIYRPRLLCIGILLAVLKRNCDFLLKLDFQHKKIMADRTNRNF